MRIGTPKEIKNHEYRVGLTPASVRELTAHGHQVLVQTDAGTAIDLTDAQYVAAVRAAEEAEEHAERASAQAARSTAPKKKERRRSENLDPDIDL